MEEKGIEEKKEGRGREPESIKKTIDISCDF